MSIYSKYPFLDGARQFIPKEFTEQYIHYAYKHLHDQAPNINFPELDVQAFLITLIMLKNADNTRLYKQWIANFCKRFESFFLKDIYVNPTVRKEVLLFFGIPDDKQTYYVTHCSMSIPHYLMWVSGLTSSNDDLKLVNQLVSKGKVQVSYQRFVLILRMKLEEIIFKRIKEKYTKNETINKYVEELKVKHPVRTYYRSSTATKTNIPPCIQFLIDKAKDTNDLEHQERVILGIYMTGKEYEQNDILEIFAQLTDYKERTTTYQLNKLKNYNCYSCDKMRDLGMCKRESDKSGKCRFIKSPYFY